MKIIFLDIDGVLNMYGSSSRTFMKPYGQHIEPHLVQRLNYIVEQTKCKIVISSSWRGDMDDLKIQLKEQGFKYWEQVIGKTIQAQRINPSPNGYSKLKYEFRGQQIKKWLEDTNFSIEKYIVIDDEISDIHGKKCKIIPLDLIVQTDNNEGMLHKDAIKIVEKLKCQ